MIILLLIKLCVLQQAFRFLLCKYRNHMPCWCSFRKHKRRLCSRNYTLPLKHYFELCLYPYIV